MELYVYRTPTGHVADFRPYLDGHDNSFDDRRALEPQDPRWEKIHGLRDPETGDAIGGQLEWVGKAELERYHELLCFPIAWSQGFEPVVS
jgi:hypothetical protein